MQQQWELISKSIIKIDKDKFRIKQQVSIRMKRNQIDGGQQQQITSSTLMLLNKQLSQNIELNSNLRMKYGQDPQRFFQSQQTINNIIEKLNQLTQQQLPLIIDSNITPSLIKLLNHPNIDIALGVVELLYDLLEQQVEDDKLFEINFRWIVWLVENSAPQAIVGILSRIDEENVIDQYEGGLKCLKLLEIFMNNTDQVYTLLGGDRQLIEYMANRIMPNYVVKHKVIDDNKYVSSDILIQLLSNSQQAQLLFAQFSGIEVLLQTISSYQTHLPQNEDEKEFLNNILSSLALLLSNHLLGQYKKIYHEMKGNYLMISFTKMKNQYSSLAFKCIANSLLNLDKESEKNVVIGLINDGALKYVFAIFKRKGLRGEDVDEQKTIDQCTLSILYCLTRSATDIYKDRLQYKLIQNRFENLQRFFELRNEYTENIDSQQASQQQKSDTATYLQKLSQGLSLIETIDKTILFFADKFNKLKTKIANLFTIYNLKYEQIQKTIKDNYKYIGIKQEKTFIESLIANNLLLLKKLLAKNHQQKDNTFNKESQIKLKLE